MTTDEREQLRLQLLAHEGLRLKPYTDTGGKLTIGCGRNLTDGGISTGEAMYLLDNDISGLLTYLTHVYPWFAGLTPERQFSVVDVAFNVGRTGLAHFPKMIAAVERGD